MEAFKMITVKKADWFEIDESDSTCPSTRSNSNVTESVDNQRKTDVVLHERAKTDIRNQSYRFRIARSWNKLPQAVREMKSMNAHKNAYNRWREKNIQLES